MKQGSKMFFHRKNFLAAAAKISVLSAAAFVAAPAAQAQFSDSYNFLKAVKDRDGTEATKYINEAGSGAVIINTRDDSSGEGALHIVVRRRDAQWTGFLLQKGANPDIADRDKITPLMLSTQLNFPEGVEWLLKYKADIDQTNRSGETALILAVQLRFEDIVRMLLKKGADPDKTDSVAGMSARDYAKRDRRAAAILTLIENNDKAEKADSNEGELDFSGIGPEIE